MDVLQTFGPLKPISCPYTPVNQRRLSNWHMSCTSFACKPRASRVHILAGGILIPDWLSAVVGWKSQCHARPGAMHVKIWAMAKKKGRKGITTANSLQPSRYYVLQVIWDQTVKQVWWLDQIFHPWKCANTASIKMGFRLSSSLFCLKYKRTVENAFR